MQGRKKRRLERTVLGISSALLLGSIAFFTPGFTGGSIGVTNNDNIIGVVLFVLGIIGLFSFGD